MTMKRRLATGAAVFGIFFVTDFVVHAVLLKRAYEVTATLWRPLPEMQSLGWLMWVLYLLSAAILPYLYAKGVEPGKSPAGQGLRFGAVMGLLLVSGMSLGTYFMIPMPLSLAACWFVAGMGQYLLAGLAIAFLHRPA